MQGVVAARMSKARVFAQPANGQQCGANLPSLPFKRASRLHPSLPYSSLPGQSSPCSLRERGLIRRGLCATNTTTSRPHRRSQLMASFNHFMCLGTGEGPFEYGDAVTRRYDDLRRVRFGSAEFVPVPAPKVRLFLPLV